MKNIKIILLVLLCSFYFVEANAQKKPVAVNDSVTTEYYTIKDYRIFQNDKNYRFEVLDTIIHLGPLPVLSFNHVDSIHPKFNCTYKYNTIGIDSFLYVVHSLVSPNFKDTAKIYVNVVYDFMTQVDTFETAFYKAIVNNAGPLFQDTRNSIAGFLIPKDSGTTTIFASNIWIAGKMGNKYQVSASTFNSDYSKNNPSPTNNHLYGGRPGPITNPSRLDEKGKREVESFLVSDAMGCFTV